jgi:hypothetical protein
MTLSRCIAGAVLVLLQVIGLQAAADDPFAKLMKENGFASIIPPRADFGTGTIVKVKNVPKNKQLYIAAQSECFPELEKLLHTNSITLENSTQSTGLGIDVSANYVPIPLLTLAGAFKKNNTKALDVTFGATTANNLTVETLRQQLEGKKVSKSCMNYLRDKNNALIIAAARTTKMTYKFTWDDANSLSVNVDALQKLKADTGLNWKNGGTNTIVLDQPMYVGYTAFRFKDLGLDVPESSTAPVVLKPGRFEVIREDISLFSTN